MNGDCPVFDMTLTAAADLQTFMYRGVKIDSAGHAVAGVLGDGVYLLQNTPKNGAAASVRAHGISFAIAGAAIAADARVMTDANGAVITATTGKVSLGRALKPATAAGEIITVLCERSVLA
jgi:hypothetical protein